MFPVRPGFGKGPRRHTDAVRPTICGEAEILRAGKPSAALSVKQKIQLLTNEIYGSGKFDLVRAFVGTIKQKPEYSDDALLYTLERFYREFLEKGRDPGDAWAYCQDILQKESGNFNARNSEAEHQKVKHQMPQAGTPMGNLVQDLTSHMGKKAG